MLGLFQAFCGPASYSLIADYFPPKSRTTAIAIYVFGYDAGGGLSSLVIPIIGKYGWRFAYLVTGGVGVVIGVLALIIIGDPKRGRFEEECKPRKAQGSNRIGTGSFQRTSTGRSVCEFTKHNVMGFVETFSNKTCLFVLLGGMARYWSYNTVSYFACEFFSDYDGKLGEYGPLNAAAIVIGGFASNFIAGQISDRLESRCHRIKSYLCVIQSLICVGVTCVCFIFTDSFYSSMAALFLVYLLTEGW